MGMRMNAIGLVASDLAASRTFYERLGCDFGTAEPPHIEAQLGSFRLMLDSESFLIESGLIPGPVGERDGFALAVEFDEPAEVDAAYAQFAADGLGVGEPFDAPWGQRYASIQDPDGAHVDLYAWLPGSRPA
jgi:catechol 2,3-dioxygenase-like lactoylglutathione lyase family enzyme